MKMNSLIPPRGSGGAYCQLPPTNRGCRDRRVRRAVLDATAAAGAPRGRREGVDLSTGPATRTCGQVLCCVMLVRHAKRPKHLIRAAVAAIGEALDRMNEGGSGVARAG